MKRTHFSKILCLGFFLLGTATSGLYANINFGSRQSTLKVSDNAKLYISSSGLTVDGTLAQSSLSTVAGRDIEFDGGILEHSGSESSITGNYSPSSSVLEMTGDSVFKFEPGTVVPAVTVDSTGNRLEGQPLFSSAIAFNESAELTLAIHNALNKNITLNSGLLVLDNDLALVDNVQIVGPGTVDLNNRQLTLGGYYSSAWNTALTLGNATSVYLSGYTALGASGHWTFPSTSRINGNGEILDLSAGGQITIAAGQKLYLEDIVIQGLGTGEGRINFGSATSELHLSNVTLAIDTDLEIASGKVIIDGQSTIVLKNHILNFTTNGKLTVNDTVLWIEPLGRITYPAIGYLRFTVGATAYDIYDANGFNEANSVAAVSAGLLTLNGDALIKKTVAQSSLEPAEQAAIGGSLTSSINLKRNFTIEPNRAITINGNLTIDADGSTLTFTEGEQFNVGAGKTVTLQNIVLTNIRSNTFTFGLNSHIRFGENVTLELVDDVTFTSNTTGTGIAALLRVMDGALSANTLLVRGLKSVRKLTFVQPASTVSKKYLQRPIQMGDNIISFENISCEGLDASVLTPGVDADATVEYPEIDLLGGSTLLISGKLKDTASTTEKPKTSIDIFVEGTGNLLVLMKDGINFGGAIFYGSKPLNELMVRFDIAEFASRRPTGIKDDYPHITLSGTGISLYSPINEDTDPVTADGIARLLFVNDKVTVEISAADAFLIDTGAELLYTNLQLLANPLQQNSVNVLIGGTSSILYGGIDTTGVRLLHKNTRKHISARKQYHAKGIARLRELELAEEVAQLKALEDADKKATKAVTEDDEILLATRSLSVPVLFDRATSVSVYEDLKLPFAGNLAYEGSELDEFTTFSGSDASPSDHAPFNLVLEDNNKVYLDNTDMTLYRAAARVDSQLINVRGLGNEIHVRQRFTIKSNLFMGEGSELTFVFVDDGSGTPTVVLDTNCLLELEDRAILRFKGTGKVIMSDGSLLYFRGDKDATQYRIGSATNRPTLILTDGAVLDFTSKANVNFAGFGKIAINNGGMIAPSTVCNLNIGAPQTYVAPVDAQHDPSYTAIAAASFYKLDDFEIAVTNNGEIRLDLPAALAISLGSDWTFKARIGIQNATASLLFEQGGGLTVGNNSLFDVNTNTKGYVAGDITHRALLYPGRIRKVSFGYNGVLFIKPTGRFSFAANRKAPINGYSWNNLTSEFGTDDELTFEWVASQARMGGAGSVYFPDKKTTGVNDVSGTFAPTKAALLTDSASKTAKELITLMKN